MTKKISKQELQQIIQEELSNVLTEEQLEEISTAGIKAAMGAVQNQMRSGIKRAKEKVQKAAGPAMQAYKDAAEQEKIQKLEQEMNIIKDKILLKLNQLRTATGNSQMGKAKFQNMVLNLVSELQGLGSTEGPAGPKPAEMGNQEE